MAGETEMLMAQDLLLIRRAITKLTQGITVAHIQQEQRYKIVIERAASTKGVDGFKVEVNGDDIEAVRKDADDLYNYAKGLTINLDKTIMEK